MMTSSWSSQRRHALTAPGGIKEGFLSPQLAGVFPPPMVTGAKVVLRWCPNLMLMNGLNGHSNG